MKSNIDVYRLALERSITNHSLRMLWQQAAKQRRQAIHTYTDFLVLFSHRVLISFPFNLARQCFDNRLVLNTNHVNGISELAAALRFDLAPAKQGHSFQYMLCLCTRTEHYGGRTGGCGVPGGGCVYYQNKDCF